VTEDITAIKFRNIFQ